MGIKDIKQFFISARNKIRSLDIIEKTRSGKIELVSRKYNLTDIHNTKIYGLKQWTVVLDMLESYNLQQNNRRKIIKVAFVLYSAAMWSCNELYRLFKEDERFETYIILARYSLDSNQKTFPTFEKSYKTLQNMGYTIETVDLEESKNHCYKAMGEPNIVIYLTPYNALLPVGINECYMPSSTLCIYIPYSYMLIKADQKFNSDGMVLSWRHFSDSELYRQMLIRYNTSYSRNTFFMGYPKMDIYYQPPTISKEDVWKLPYGEQAKCIVYAPHHSLRGATKCAAHFSTFDDNYHFMLEYAEKHQETTSWIIKPHPNLKMTVLETGLFKDEKEYNDYLNRWAALPNARVVEESTYYDIFKTSDAMICDSVSFLAEYQFTGKPLLLLTRPEQEFNEFGEKVREILYAVSGNDTAGIEQFIKDVVIDGNDIMKATREQFFKTYLDYRSNGEESASKQIYDHICEAIDNA